MNVFICDDDRKDIARLKALIDDYDSKKHIGFTVSGYRSGKRRCNVAEHVSGQLDSFLYFDGQHGSNQAEHVGGVVQRSGNG